MCEALKTCLAYVNVQKMWNIIRPLLFWNNCIMLIPIFWSYLMLFPPAPHLDCSCAFCYLLKFSSSSKSLLNSNLFHESADLSLLWIVLHSQHVHSLAVRCSHCSCYWSWLPTPLMLLAKLYMKQAIQGSRLFFLKGGLLF